MRIAVAGGTGVVGRHVVDIAVDQGHEVVTLARSAGVDLVTGAGLAARLDGVDVVVDVTGTREQKRAAAEDFFGGVTARLLSAEVDADVRHHVTLSIVGVDDVDTGYYAGKRRQEQVVTSGPVPWTLLRATQFHEFAEQALGFVRLGPVSLVPKMRTQPIAAQEVAQALAALALGAPAGRAADLAGPEQHDLVVLARRVAAVRRAGGRRQRVVPVGLPGSGGRAMREGALLPSSDGPRGRQTFDQWLAGA
ncbi:MAG: NAD(P)H-binding protein [Nocardioides sp.]|uniref:SDR family oxidoreductase n=1 Tax=Nocardioides sp. TaxID=35761 RepID=UPI000C90CF42|nr:NAD(P)H-binding protein [Nocardioides sp.]MAS54821.1 3-beta hydroxysteroid dehydrogenase [Pimelobacter sp.]MDE0778243.1 NAD(P)H-binding protein [Nocardioides sp.]